MTRPVPSPAALMLAVLVPAALALTGCSSDPVTAPAGPVTGTPQVGPELQSALDDVEAVAPALEGFYRNNGYPADLAGAVASLQDAGLSLSRGNTLGSYTYDAEAVEFALCVENASGAFATYDTAPMALRQSGTTGGCP